MRDFQQLLTEPYREIVPVATTWYEQGQESGQRKLLVTQIEDLFRKLTPEELRAIESKSSEEIIALGKKFSRVRSIEELGLLNGLQQH